VPSGTPRRAGRTRRSPREWAGRIALACGLAVLGYYGVAFSAAQVTANSRPQAADAMLPYDGRLGAAHAAELLTQTTTPDTRAQAAALSRAALRRDPTAVAAAATLGVVTLEQGRTGEARRLLGYARMLSRRNVPTQLWAIEDAVARNDVPGALRWYDVALRTKPAMGEVLYPVLAQAARDPAIRTALIQTLAGKPLWADSYIGYAAGQKDDPQSTAALFAGLRARGVAIPPAAQASVVVVLLDGGDVGEAWRYYAAIRPGAARTRNRDPRFTALLETPSLFDWVPVNDGNVSTSVQRTREGGVFEFSAPASIGGTVLQQVQLLPAGSYRLSGHSDGIAQDARALPYWTLTCRADGREIGRVTVPNSAQAGGNFAGTLTVPATCPVQVLALFAQPSDAIGGISGQIDRVVLAPTG
jgi:hypothetical protein